MIKIKKQISLLLTATLILGQLLMPYRIMAQATPPTAPVAPTAPTAPTPPPNPYLNPNPTSAPTPTPQPSNQNTPTPTSGQTQTTPTPTMASENPTPTPVMDQSASNQNTGSNSTNDSSVNNNNQTDITTNNDADVNNDLVLVGSTGGNESDRNTGDAVINSGNTSIGGSVQNEANQTLSSVPTCGATSCTTIVGGQASSNENTGSGSANNSANTNNSATTITNNNTADLDTGLIAIADTGHNSADKNTGSAYIDSGDANIGLTVVNLANTNITGVTTSEYNIVDDHQGDIVIDFANLSATPINSGSSAANSATGANSNNNSVVDNNSSLTVVNNNDAQIVSDVVVDAVTGKNSADKNTGDAVIKSGDANILTNVVNLANNTLTSGAEILIATVNVFGDWIGNLILTDSSSDTACTTCGQGASAQNSQTGANSNNAATASSNTVTALETNNIAEIGNGVILNANTGDNSVDKNTGGGSVETGEVNATTSVNNIANNNTNGGTWWLVIVNEAGHWIGHILGADESGNIAQAGSVDLGSSNENTGAESNNSASNTNSESTSITQNNNANVDTNIVINADTGHNSAEKNTGNASISTGDVNVATNIVNFVNNNFVGGKVILTFVNVFGSWLGDVVTPNGTAAHNSDGNIPEVGGQDNETTIVESSSSNNSQTASTSSEESATESSDEYDLSANASVIYTSRAVVSKRNRVLAAHTIYKNSEETSERLSQGKWLIDVDKTITVTPSPIASASVDESENNVWWRVLAGLSISILAAISTQFRYLSALLPKN